MHSCEVNPESGDYIQQVAKKFVALYYQVLNNYPAYLPLFYGSDSSVVVCEVKDNGATTTNKATNISIVEEMLKTLYQDVAITIHNCTPQPSANGCISLLVTGYFTKKTKNEESAFTQALILSRQSDGYYVKTDTVLLLPKARGTAGVTSLLPSSLPCRTEIVAEMDGNQNAPPTERAPLLQGGSEVSHVRVPAIDVKPGTQLIGNTVDSQLQKLNGKVRGATSQAASNDGFASNVRPTRNCPTGTDYNLADINRRGHVYPSVVSMGSAVYLPYGSGYIQARCASPLSAPGALAPPPSGEGLISDCLRYQTWSHNPSPRREVVDAKNPQTDCRKLFACKLPKDVTVEEVTSKFSVFGQLAADEPVKVFLGQNNAYACVTFVDEDSIKRVFEANIQIRDQAVVTDAWRPRDKRPKRRRSDQTHTTTYEVVAGNTAN